MRCNIERIRQQIVGRLAVASLCLLGFIGSANALPFNQDMVGTQLANGKVMRPLPEGSVQRGASSRYVGTREEAGKLVNTKEATPSSIENGARLFSANCSPCHGRYIEGKYVAGEVSQYLPGPNLQSDYYKTKTDAHFFQFIHFGGMALMPAYGWKFSLDEHWDIVNYIRNIQGKQFQK